MNKFELLKAIAAVKTEIKNEDNSLMRAFLTHRELNPLYMALGEIAAAEWNLPLSKVEPDVEFDVRGEIVIVEDRLGNLSDNDIKLFEGAMKEVEEALKS